MYGVQLMALCLGVESVLSSSRVRLQSVTVSQYGGVGRQYTLEHRHSTYIGHILI